ncbi:hypothetical protein HB13667_07445 [Pseudomonas putida]|uniref:Uncharacterized protein n=1 Tax=Pseudomonas putida TaxID=303 RepID=A0A0P7DAH9_PSEPU|nr:hypothetical protein HB13667_07445 [Pseudomonas putida]
MLVLLIAYDAHSAQIFNAVVVTNAVNVVDLAFWPFAIGDQPDNAMHPKSNVVDLHAKVAVAVWRSCKHAGHGPAATPDQIHKLSVLDLK